MKMWMLSMPNLSEKIFIQSCKKLGLQPQSKILALTDDQWDKLEELCASAIGLPPNWKDVNYDHSVATLRRRDGMSNYQEYKMYYKDKVHKEDIKPKRAAFEEDDNLTLF